MIKVLLVALIISALGVLLSSPPIFTALGLVLMALVLGLSTWTIASKWAGLAIILVFIGGMMVVFLYVTSLSANMKFQMPANTILIALAVGISLSFLNWSFCASPTNILFFYHSSFMLGYLVTYLLLALFLVVKISESFKGSLSQKFF